MTSTGATMTFSISDTIKQFLSTSTPIDETIVQEFGEKCKVALRTLQEEKNTFTLRMSNIGRDPRLLYLQATSKVKEQPDPTFKMKVTYGHLIEHLMIALMKAAGLKVEEPTEQVALKLKDTTIKGTYDVKVNGQIIDIKSASPYSYERKFNSCASLMQGDEFGYIGQAVAYQMADNTKFKGWLVINKATGEFKDVDTDNAFHSPTHLYEWYNKFNYAVDVVTGKADPPPCTGVEDETFRSKPTGHKVLGNKCKYCPAKGTCHPGILYEPARLSQAKEREWKWYLPSR